MLLVFINAPDCDIRDAILLAEEMWNDGIVGLVPNMHVFQDLVSPFRDDDWLLIHKELLGRCDAVLHRDGSGHLLEAATAAGKPVFHTYRELYAFAREGLDG